MNKVARTLHVLNRRNNLPRTLREMFHAQKLVVDFIANDDYWAGYDAILSRHNLTRQQFMNIIRDPALYSFYSPGLPEQYVAVNKEIAKYCRSRGVFTPDWTINAFADHVNHAVKAGQIVRHGKRGSYTYTLPKERQ